MADLDRSTAIEAALGAVPDDVVVVYANGYLAREGFRIRPEQPDFHMLGSMGLAASIGVGLVTARPDRPVVVVDGDGNLLMGLAGLPVVAAIDAGTFVHLVVDDAQFSSTGGQPTLSSRIDLVGLARSSGYATTVSVRDAVELAAAVRQGLCTPGAHLVHIPIRGGTPPSGRVTRPPDEIAARVIAHYRP
jgi:thiamine pyrophosphate-dependent acetolactate synthase large subunit-like protein